MGRDVFTYGHRTAVVTGGSKNIGLAIAERLLQAGVQVAIVGSNADHLQAAMDHLHGLGHTPSGCGCLAKPAGADARPPRLHRHLGELRRHSGPERS
jgi:NAD(P)-dependent dehydrogenase (short-subunit alcohol dehydrogenase family)